MHYDIVSIVASTRGLPALRELLGELPSSFHVPVLCLVESHHRLVEELQACTRLRVRWAEPGVRMEKGCVYLSRPESSLVCIEDGRVSVTPFGPHMSSLTPVDQFLTSVAACYRERGLALALSGFDHDGVKGSAAIKRHGGTMLVLDRATAAYWGMAEPVIRAGHCDRVLSTVEVAEALRACFTGMDLVACAEIQVELRGLLDTALMLSGTRMGHIQRLQKEAGKLRVVVQRGVGVDFFERFDGMPADAATACGRAVVQRSRVVVEDVGADEVLARAAADAGVRAIHATPLLVEGSGVVGVVATHFTQPHKVTPYEARDLDAIAHEAAQILARLR